MSFAAFVGHGLTHLAGDTLKPAVSAIAHITNFAAPIEVPTPMEVIDMHRRGWISNSTLSNACALSGVNIDVTATDLVTGSSVGNDAYKALWNAFYYATQERPTISEYLEIANRQFIPDANLPDQLRRWGYIDEDYRKWIANLHYEIPSSSDLVRFSVRHVFEPDLIAKLRYNDEFNPYLDFWHKLQGLNYPIIGGPFQQQWVAWLADLPVELRERIKDYGTYGLVAPTWAQAFWWSHWVLPSPTQGYLMWQRLNPFRDRRWDGPEMQGVDFSYEDLQLLLRANDYPPYYRGLLAAISRPIPGIRYARDFRRTGVYGIGELLAWADRQGYSPRDAEDIATDIDESVRLAEEKAVSCKGCKLAEAAYEMGIIDLADLRSMLSSFGQPPEQIELLVQETELDLRVRRAKEVVSAIRRQFLLGALSDLQARQQLQQYGIVITRIDAYLEDWDIERRFKMKEVSAAKVVAWACKGLITTDNLSMRLVNLSYQPADIAGLVAEAQYCAATLAARAAAQLERQQEKKQKAILQAQKEAARAYKELAKMLAGRATPADLRKWYCEGHVTELEVFHRLTYLGWPDADICRFLDDCKGGSPKPACATGGRRGGQ